MEIDLFDWGSVVLLLLLLLVVVVVVVGTFTRDEWVELLSAIAIKAPLLLLLLVAKGRRIGQWGSSEEEEVGKERDSERQ